MAPKPSSISVNTPTQESVLDDEGRPWLDGDDMNVPLFLAALDIWLQAEHPHQYAFIENNFITDRQYTIVWTAEQAADIAAGRAPEHSFKDPPKPLASTHTKLLEDLSGRYKVQPDVLRATSRALYGTLNARMERGTAKELKGANKADGCLLLKACLLYTSPSPRDVEESRMPSSA